MTTTVLLVLAVLFGFYMLWNIGANDVANAVGTVVGSGALTLKQAVVIAAIFEFLGAFLLGSSVSETVEAKIVDPGIFTGDRLDYVYGMLASLLAAGIWLQIASYFGWPVSTTHTIIGAVLGFGLALGGIGCIFWGQILSIAASWIISPLIGGAVAYLIFTIIRRRILYQLRPIQAAKKLTPYLVFIIFFVLTLIILFGGFKGHNFDPGVFAVLLIALGAGIFPAILSIFLVRRIHEPEIEGPRPNPQVEVSLRKAQKHLARLEAASMGEQQRTAHHLLEEVKALSKQVEVPEEHLESDYAVVEKIFIYFQIIIAPFMAFAHGSNDVANAIGPLSAIINTLKGNPIMGQSIPMWLLILGGVGIVFGLATWGWRVIETVGRKITELTPSRGFAAGFAAAITIVLASKLGLPISTTHVLVGAVLGVGFARGIGALNLNVIRDIVISWVITVPAGAILSVLFFYGLRAIFSS